MRTPGHRAPAAVLLLSAVGACAEPVAPFVAVADIGSLGGPVERPQQAGRDEAPSADPPGFELPALVDHNTGDLATSLACEHCHANDDDADAMRDAKGRPIAPFDLWRATSMANSARDPFWWAMMAAEVAVTPAAQAEIEATCLRCHAPMAGVHNAQIGASAPTRADLLHTGTTGKLGIDGVACALCHQIAPDGLGTEASYTGGFVIAQAGRMYGPHASPFTMPMKHHTGFTPTRADHITDSSLCGTCHTLQTETLDPDGAALEGHFPEQATYLEWRNSDFRDEAPAGPRAAGCGACHLPTRDDDGQPISTRLARRPHGGDFPPLDDRDPYGRHIFVGGNTLLPALLRDHADDLRPNADAAAFDAIIARTRDQLARRSATLDLDIARNGDTLLVDAAITNITGHKFPSGYPSRRLWLRVLVTGGQGERLFVSGEVDAQGRLIDAAGVPLASELLGGPVQPHHREIDRGDLAQVYESVMADKTGAPAFRLLRGRSFAKDNRLLPAGWDPGHPDAARTAPAGVGDDPDFLAAGDTTRYRVHAPAAGGPYTVAVELLYQPLAPRFAAELFAIDAAEVRAFEALYDAADHAPEHVAAAERTVD